MRIEVTGDDIFSHSLTADGPIVNAIARATKLPKALIRVNAITITVNKETFKTPSEVREFLRKQLYIPWDEDEEVEDAKNPFTFEIGDKDVDNGTASGPVVHQGAPSEASTQGSATGDQRGDFDLAPVEVHQST